MKPCTTLIVTLAIAPAALAADLEAGKVKALTVCAACHGANGVSVSDEIPNLAGQRTAYLEGQLKALKVGTRKDQIMNPIAAQLSNDDIANVSAYFGSLPGAAVSAKSAFLPHVVKSNVAFPEDYPTSFTRYRANNSAQAKQVVHNYANAVAVSAAREDRSLPDGSVLMVVTYAAKLDADKQPVLGSDGFFVPDRALGYTVMAREAGWGKDIPEMLRNENWNYAIFGASKQRRSDINQAECLGCHKGLDNSSYTFTLERLRATAKGK